jgi:hypothetical protein
MSLNSVDLPLAKITKKKRKRKKGAFDIPGFRKEKRVTEDQASVKEIKK